MANTTMPNGTQYHTWKPEPLVRGTFSILSSSLLTMILCVWTAVHLNIPAHEKDDVKAQTWRIPPQTWRKSGWMVIAIFAPEWVVLTACCQHIAANDIGKTMRKAFGQPESTGLMKILSGKFSFVLRWLSVNLSWNKAKAVLNEQAQQPIQQGDVELANTEPVDVELNSKPKRYPWTHTHSLYATMGGFVVDTRGMGLNYLPNGRQRMTLTLQCLKFIAAKAPDLLPDIPASAIVDKSKANAFTKLVTCGQAVWFCIQCATRSAQGLTISLLEINTAVHAICTLVMYFQFWWHKPLDVEEPTMLTDAEAHSVIAFLVITRKFVFVHVSPKDMEDDEHFDSVPDSEEVINHPIWDHIQFSPSKDPRFPSTEYVVYHGFAIPRLKNDPNPCPGVNEVDLQCFKLASESARKYRLRVTKSIISDYVRVRLRNRPSLIDSGSNAEWNSSLVGFPLAGLLYGSVHLLVWDRPFRGEADELLWKISSLTILLSGVPMAVWYLSLHMDQVRWISSHLSWTIQKFTTSLAACFVVFYIFCRAFIIVECFLDVFHLPDSAFEVPQWSQYFPHI